MPPVTSVPMLGMFGMVGSGNPTDAARIFRCIEAGDDAVVADVTDEGRIGQRISVESGIEMHDDAEDEAGVVAGQGSIAVGVTEVGDFLHGRIRQ